MHVLHYDYRILWLHYYARKKKRREERGEKGEGKKEEIRRTVILSVRQSIYPFGQ